MIASFTRVIGGRPVTVRAAASQEPMAEDVFGVLERLARRQPLRDGLRIRFGWSLLTLRGVEGGIVVCEPDFDREPLRDLRPLIETTLEVTAKQVAFARAFRLAPVDVAFDQYLVVTRGKVSAREVQLYRHPAESPDDSGWSLTAADADPALENAGDYEALRVHRLLRERPVVLPVLVLPVGYAVLIEGDRVRLVLDPEGRQCLPAS